VILIEEYVFKKNQSQRHGRIEIPPDMRKCITDINFVSIPYLFFYLVGSSDGLSVFPSFESVDMMDNILAFDCQMMMRLADVKIKEGLNPPDLMTGVESRETTRKPSFCS
jgi:hypothetical protein